jgi:hypothetical protein
MVTNVEDPARHDLLQSSSPISPGRIRSVNPHHSATTISKTKLLEKGYALSLV